MESSDMNIENIPQTTVYTTDYRIYHHFKWYIISDRTVNTHCSE